MSGQYPAQAHCQPLGAGHQVMDNISGWNYSGHRPPQALPGTIPFGQQSVEHGMIPQASHIPASLTQLPVHPSRNPKVLGAGPGTALNGSGSGVPMNMSCIGPQPTSTPNSLLNLHMFVNQDSNPVASRSTTGLQAPPQGGSVDLSYGQRTSAISYPEPISLVASRPQRESPGELRNGGVLPVPLNGELNTLNSSAPAGSAKLTQPSSDKEDIVVIKKCASIHDQPTGDRHPNTLTNLGVGMNKIGSISEKKDQLVTNNEKASPKGSTTLSANLEDKLKEETSGDHSQDNSKEISRIEEKMPISTAVPSDASEPATTPQNAVVPLKINPNTRTSAATAPGSAKQDIVDVESQMEALFAGIADGGVDGEVPGDPDQPGGPQGTPNVAAILESKGSSSKKGKSKTSNGIQRGENVFGSSSTDSTPKKKQKKRSMRDKPWEEEKFKKHKKSGSVKGRFLKEASCDSGSNASSSRIRGPVVHVEGSKEAPISVTIITAPSRADDEENESKKKNPVTSRSRNPDQSEGKMTSTGLCSNSLVSRQETHSSDPRWMCVFCKRGSHVEGMGDLFGPYLINQDTDLENSQDLDGYKVGDKKDKKNKRSGFGQTGVQGLLAIPPLANESPQFIVWVHEDCAVWSSGVHLIGSRLAGLQEAVWSAVHSKCTRCHVDGANVGCLQHGCSRRAHFSCAADEGWNLNEDTFISTCNVHRSSSEV